MISWFLYSSVWAETRGAPAERRIFKTTTRGDLLTDTLATTRDTFDDFHRPAFGMLILELYTINEHTKATLQQYGDCYTGR